MLAQTNCGGVLISFGTAKYGVADKTELLENKNHNRVLLVFTPSASDGNYDENHLEQKRLLKAAEDGLPERDMVVLELLTDETSKALKDYFNILAGIIWFGTPSLEKT